MDKLGFNLQSFVGVVEDRMDPEMLGRVRVRCLGYHTEILCNDDDSSASGGGGSGQQKCIDTSQLPWAVPIQPTTSAAMNGIGTSPSGLVEGTWVFGVFIDGQSAQQPIILGAFAGTPECVNPGGDPEIARDECDELSIQTEGFYDPRKDEDLEDAPRPPKRINYKKAASASENSDGGGGGCELSFKGYKDQSHNPAQKESTDGCLAKGFGEVGIELEENDAAEHYPIEGKNEYETRKESFKLEPDTNRLARNRIDDRESYDEDLQDKTLLKWKRDNIDKGVPTAEMPDITSDVPKKCAFYVGPNASGYYEPDSKPPVKSLGTKWEEPETPYDAKYPYNKVKETESGHVEEWDDTPGAERYHRFHRAGSFVEIHPDGTRVEKIVGERYTIILENDKIHIEANADITIDKAAKIYVNADNQEGNHLDIQVGDNSDLNLNVGRNINLYSKDSLNIKTDKDLSFNVGGDVLWRVGGCVDKNIGGNIDLTVGGNYDQAVLGDVTKSVFGSTGVIEEIQYGNYTQRIYGTSYVISGGLMTEIGLGDITMNPLSRPGAVEFVIPESPDCQCDPCIIK